jgi:hypothetical protein
MIPIATGVRVWLELDQLRIDLGAKRKRSVGGGDLTKIVFDLPTSVNENFARSLRTHLVTQTTESWMFWYGLLEAFVKEQGHCRVPQTFKIDDGYRLGQWVAVQRRYKETMEPDRRQRLEALPGWSWAVWLDKWEEGFSHLKQFLERGGDCRGHQGYKTDDDYQLRQWVANQREAKHKMKSDRRQRLEGLPGWSWDPFSDQWEEALSYMKKFSDREGHCRVPRGYKTDDGYRLDVWVSNQRRAKDKMEPDRRQRLEALPGWSWNTLLDQWEEGFSHVKQFSDREGHCRVPRGYKTDDGYRLGQWVAVQRWTKDTMEPDRGERLEVLPGWSWDFLLDQWEEGFSHVKQFSDREGHCRVPDRYKTNDGYPLGSWVRRQRTNKDKMESDRRQRLEGLPGWSWDVLSDLWEEGFSHVKQFSDREGHCRVFRGYKTDDDYPLGAWVSRQREAKDTMEPDHRQRFEELPGWSWDVLSDLWEEGFSHVRKFSDREGHCRVPQGYKTDDDYPLGAWVSRQREAKDKMKSDRRQRLEALPGWVWKVEK